jgi:hypothetical protein
MNLLPEFAEQVEHEREQLGKLEHQLLMALIGTTIYLVLVGTGSIVAALVLLGPTKESDLARVAALALCGGAIGGTVRALFAVMEEVQRGVWELADGTIVERSERRVARVRQRFLEESAQAEDATSEASEPDGDEGAGDTGAGSEKPDDLTYQFAKPYLTTEERAELAAREAERKELRLSKVAYAQMKKAEADARHTWGFGIQDIPWLILHPLLGAALGLIAFAGLIGGFLVASGTKAPSSYSPAGLLFVAVLAGLFSPNFIAGLARAADAIFGKTQPERKLTASDQDRDPWR